MTRTLRCWLGLFLALGALRAVLYAAFGLIRLDCQFESYPLEAKMVLLAYRVQAGESLYPEWRNYPHVANFFGPVYFLVVGLLGRAIGSELRGLFLIGRVISFTSVFGTAFVLAVFLKRRYGTGAATAGALLSLGGLPLYGFSLMARPDLLAEFLGVGGFFLSGFRWRGSYLAGGVLLVLAILTKQTAGVFLIAAVAALFLEGARRRALGLLVGCSIGLVLVVAAVTLFAEPEFVRSLLGESKTPWDAPNWWGTLERTFSRAPDYALFAVLGPILWISCRPWEIRPLILTLVVIAFSLLLSGKRGADVNYYLSFRVIEGLAAGSLWHAARSARSPRSRRWLALASASAALILLPSVGMAVLGLRQGARMAEFQAGPAGVAAEKSYRHILAVAEDPNRRLLTDSGYVDLFRRKRAEFGDPWLFRMLVETGRIHPATMLRAIEQGGYDVVVTTSELESPKYATYEFGLPMILVEPIRQRYFLVGREAGLFFYKKREFALPPPRRVPASRASP